MAEPEAQPRGESRVPAGDTIGRVRGQFRFAVDRRAPGALHAAVVRSTVAHGRIQAVDAADALDLAGVRAVIDGAQLTQRPDLEPWYGETRADQPVLAIDKVRYVGEPVAIVVADSRAVAEEAAARVVVEIDELPYVTDAELAGEPDAPQLHQQWPGNACGEWDLIHGDAERAMRDAYHVHTGVYRSPVQSHVPLEPHVATAGWLPDGSLEVWTGTQSPYVVRKQLASIFRLAPERVRVRGDNLGGGFGSKLDLKVEGLVAVASLIVGAPVRLELRRDEVFLITAKHAAAVTITTGASQDGTLLARTVDIVWNAGAYALSTPRASRTGMIRSSGPYRIPHLRAHSTARYTNTVPTGPFRGAMTGQVCWAHESAMDEIAADLGIDPVQLRRRNLLADGDTFATGDVMQDLHYHQLLDAAAAGLDQAESERSARRAGPHLVRGRGFGAVLKTTRTPSRSEAMVEARADGQLVVRTSSVEMGQGAARSLAELAARRLDIDAGQVSVSLPDTAFTPFDQTTSSSRTTYAMGLAVERAADDLRQRIDAHAAQLWDVATSPLRHHEGRVSHPTQPAGLSYPELLARAGVTELVGHGVYQSPPGAGELDPETSQGNASVHFHQGVVAVDVEVDPETGRVAVLAAHGATYGGRVVDAERSHKQVQGGMVFGLGQALMEELRYDSGEPMDTNLSDYQIPSIMDAPYVTSTVLENSRPDAEPHGIGESTVPPMAPAIANAVCAATGARVRDLPLTAEKLLRALREAQPAQPDADRPDQPLGSV